MKTLFLFMWAMIVLCTVRSPEPLDPFQLPLPPARQVQHNMSDEWDHCWVDEGMLYCEEDLT